jgi:hypothetical protein
VAAGEEADGEPFDHLVLANDDFPEFRAEGLVGFAEFVDGGHIVGRELKGEVKGGIHDLQVEAKLGAALVLSRRDVGRFVLHFPL